MRLNKKKALEELGIPDDLYEELLKTFTVQLEEVIQQLEAATGSEDFDKITERAHFLKGSAGNLRVEEVYLQAVKIETAGKQKQDWPVIRNEIAGLKKSLEELKELMKGRS